MERLPQVANLFRSSYLHPVLSAYLALLGVTVFWGFTFPVVQQSLNDCSPILFVALRFLLAGLLVPVILGRTALRLSPTLVKRGVVLGLFLCGGYVLQTIGLAYTTSPRAGFITALYVPLTPLFGWLFFRARIRKRMWGAAALAFAGIVILALPETITDGRPVWQQLVLNRGDQLVLGCAACYALHILLINRWSTPDSELPLTWIQLSVTGLLALLLVPVEQPHITLTPALLGSLAFTAVIASVIAIWAMMRFQPRLPVTGAAIVYSMEPVMAGLAAWLLQNHVPPHLTILGAALILAAMLIASTIQERELPQT